MRTWIWPLAALTLLTATACDTEEVAAPAGVLPEEELPIGEIDDLKTDGGWGEALKCKPIPQLPPLVDPSIVISLDGLTLHLVDPATGYDKVFPIGPGAIEKGASLTPVSTSYPEGVFYARLDQPEAQEGPDKHVWAWNYSCRMWWKDSSTGKEIPVFAGLPFIRLEGPNPAAYALHGPIDSYTLPNGGKLKRGFVSHGCVRMEAADILEVYARCNGKRLPVRIQRAVERDEDGTAIDLEQRWILSECQVDADCNYKGGICKHNPFNGKGFCTAACTKYCDYDKWGYPVSFCVADPDDDEKGICTLKSSPLNNGCLRYPGVYVNPGEPRFGDAKTMADVCLPGSEGWVGDACYTDADCILSSGTCDLDGVSPEAPGHCTLPCTKYCPDLAGHAPTFCVTKGGEGQCAAKCALDDDCTTGTTCTESVPRHNQPSVKASVCQ